MNDEMLMGVGDRRTDFAEELQPIRQAELTEITKVIEPLSFDVFHHEIRHSILHHGAAIKPRDVRVRQAGEDAFLLAKMPEQIAARERAFDELQCDLSA